MEEKEGDGEERLQEEEKWGREKRSKETDKTEIYPIFLDLHTQINVERIHSETRHEGNISKMHKNKKHPVDVSLFLIYACINLVHSPCYFFI